MDHHYKIFGLTAGKKLTDDLCQRLGIQPGNIEIIRFADNEVMVRPLEYVRGKDIVLIQSTAKPVNENYMELLIAIDAMRRASAKTINIVVPYLGYSRQDRKSNPREPITFKLIANMLQNAGATRILTWDIHSPQTQGFFDIPFDSVEAVWILIAAFIEKTQIKNFTIVAPDYGAVKRVRDISVQIGVPLAIIDKRRPEPNKVEICNVLGDVNGKNCLLIDDMIDTGGTIINGAKFLKENGANSVAVLATHALFNGNAIQKLEQAVNAGYIDWIFVSDTIHQPISPFINVVSVMEQLEDIIRVFNSGQGSLSITIEKPKQRIIKWIKCIAAQRDDCEIND